MPPTERCHAEHAAPLLRRAINAFTSPDASAEEVLRWGWLASRAALLVWDYDSCLEIATRAVQFARDSGALEVLAVADNACGTATALSGDFASTSLLIAEVDAVKQTTGTRIAPHAALAVAGIRGHEAEASELIGHGAACLRRDDLLRHSPEHPADHIHTRSVQVGDVGRRRRRRRIGDEDGEAERRVEIVRPVDLLRTDRERRGRFTCAWKDREMGHARDGPPRDDLLRPVHEIPRVRRGRVRKFREVPAQRAEVAPAAGIRRCQ